MVVGSWRLDGHHCDEQMSRPAIRSRSILSFQHCQAQGHKKELFGSDAVSRDNHRKTYTNPRSSGLYAVGIVPMDLGMQNLLWNEIEKQW